MSLSAVGYLIGGGSMSLGVERAGFKLESIWETKGYSKNAKTWDLNRPELKCNVLDLDDQGRIPNIYGTDLIYGNPPCGGLSTMTGAKLESPTNRCMVQWAHMVAKNQPRMILMENGYAISTDRALPLYDELRGILNSAGYWVWTWQFYSWQLGCPQTRRRAFICATKDKPKEEYVSLADLPMDWGNMSVMDYIWDLEHTKPQAPPVWTAAGRQVTDHWWDRSGQIVSDYLPQYHQIALEKNFMTPRQAERWRNGSPKEQEEFRKRFEAGLYWPDCPAIFQSMQQFRRPDETPMIGPCHTILADFKNVHPTKNRLMTMRELARMTGYADNWYFHECRAYILAQGVPAFNSEWAARRLARAAGIIPPYERDPNGPLVEPLVTQTAVKPKPVGVPS